MGVCKICGDEIIGFAPADYREAHPGQSSPAPSHKKKKGPGGLTRGNGIEGATDSGVPAGPEQTFTPNPPAPGPVESVPDFGDAAVPPTIVPPRRGLRDRLGLSGSKEPRPTVVAMRPMKRKSGADLLSSGWNLLGMGVKQADGPVGMCLQYQAPVAGEILDGVFAGGRIDRGIIQPWVKRAEEGQAIGALLALPALIYLHEHTGSDDVRLMIEPWIEEAVLSHLSAMGPVMQKRAAKEKELQKITDEMRANDLLPPEATSPREAVRLIVQSMFTPTVADAHPQPEPDREPEDVAV